MAIDFPTAADRQPRSGAGRDVMGRLGRLVVMGLVGGLALFHSQLLWQRIASFTLFEPLVALRWGGAALLLVGFALLQRAGISVIWGHKALILWLLVLLCHAGAVVPVEAHQPLIEPGLLLAISMTGFALRAILGVLDRLAGGYVPAFTHLLPASRPPRRSRDPRFLRPFSPRPPPAG